MATYVAQWFDKPITAALVFVTGVIAIGAHSGLRNAFIAAIAAAAIYNFVLSEPAFRFGVTSADELVPLIAFNISALITGALAGRVRDSERAALRAEANSSILLQFSDSLQSAIQLADVERIAGQALAAYGVDDLRISLSNYGDLVEEYDDHESTLIAFPVRSMPDGSASQGSVRFHMQPSTAESAEQMPDPQAITKLLSLAVDRCILLEKLAETHALQRSEELKSAILSSVSHDLRTPITAIRASASTLSAYQGELSGEKKDELLETIVEQCHKLNRYTANLLDMGRIQAGIPASQLEDVDVADILGVVFGHVRSTFAAQKLKKKIEPGSVMVRANAAMLEQSIFNIVENAIVHGQSSEPVEVHLHQSEGQCLVEITDHGPGIPKSSQPHIFERFYRAEKQANGRGTGLGLFIAEGFVAAFGGSITVESPLNGAGGTRMVISLPLASSLSTIENPPAESIA